MKRWYSLAYNNGICNHQPVISISWKKNLLINGLYQKKGVLLPVHSNQKMNAYLKEIADLCGIQKNLTTHCARHTFATTVTLANKISMESVSKMLGHSSLTITQKYAKILDTSIGLEMSQLADKMKTQMS